MAKVSYSPTTETIAATTAQTITFQESRFPVGGLQSILVSNTGANNHLGTTTTAIDQVNVYVNSVPIVRALAAQLRALNEAMNVSNYIPTADRLRYTVPLNLPLIPGVWGPTYPAGAVGIPFGVKVSMEQILNVGNSSAGTSRPAWKTLDANPQYMPRFITQNMQLAASQNNQRVDLKTGLDLVVGWALPLVGATGITRLRIVQVVDGKETQVFHGDQAAILESQQQFNPASLITTSFFFRLDEPMVFPPGSYMEVDGGAGTSTSDNYAPYSLVKL